MPNSLLRIIAALLVPCLIADPSWASRFGYSDSPTIRVHVATPAFQEQALTLALGEIIPSILPRVGVRHRRMEAAAAKIEKTSKRDNASSLFEFFDEFEVRVVVWKTPVGIPLFAFPAISRKHQIKPVQYFADQSESGGGGTGIEERVNQQLAVFRKAYEFAPGAITGYIFLVDEGPSGDWMIQKIATGMRRGRSLRITRFDTDTEFERFLSGYDRNAFKQDEMHILLLPDDLSDERIGQMFIRSVRIRSFMESQFISLCLITRSQRIFDRLSTDGELVKRQDMQPKDFRLSVFGGKETLSAAAPAAESLKPSENQPSIIPEQPKEAFILSKVRLAFEYGWAFFINAQGRREGGDVPDKVLKKIEEGLAKYPDPRARQLIDRLSPGEESQPMDKYRSFWHVLDEVIKNSARAIQETGKVLGSIRFVSMICGGTWILRAEDDGKGLRGVDRSRLFTLKYTTKDSEEWAEEMSGFGLFYSKEFIERMLQGTMTLVDNETDLRAGPGATVIITAPLTDRTNQDGKGTVPPAAAPAADFIFDFPCRIFSGQRVESGNVEEIRKRLPRVYLSVRKSNRDLDDIAVIAAKLASIVDPLKAYFHQHYPRLEIINISTLGRYLWGQTHDLDLNIIVKENAFDSLVHINPSEIFGSEPNFLPKDVSHIDMAVIGEDNLSKRDVDLPLTVTNPEYAKSVIETARAAVFNRNVVLWGHDFAPLPHGQNNCLAQVYRLLENARQRLENSYFRNETEKERYSTITSRLSDASAYLNRYFLPEDRWISMEAVEGLRARLESEGIAVKDDLKNDIRKLYYEILPQYESVRLALPAAASSGVSERAVLRHQDMGGRAAPVVELNPTGLLARGIRNVSKEMYEFIRTKGLRSANARGVKEMARQTYVPDKVALALSMDSAPISSALEAFGPAASPWHVAFVIDPHFVRAHPDEFDLLGEFLERPEYQAGLAELGLQNRPLLKNPGAFHDQIHADFIPPEAIKAIIVHSDRADQIREWNHQLNLEPLPLYVYDRKSRKVVLLPSAPSHDYSPRQTDEPAAASSGVSERAVLRHQDMGGRAAPAQKGITPEEVYDFDKGELNVSFVMQEARKSQQRVRLVGGSRFLRSGARKDLDLLLTYDGPESPDSVERTFLTAFKERMESRVAGCLVQMVTDGPRHQRVDMTFSSGERTSRKIGVHLLIYPNDRAAAEFFYATLLLMASPLEFADLGVKLVPEKDLVQLVYYLLGENSDYEKIRELALNGTPDFWENETILRVCKLLQRELKLPAEEIVTRLIERIQAPAAASNSKNPLFSRLSRGFIETAATRLEQLHFFFEAAEFRKLAESGALASCKPATKEIKTVGLEYWPPFRRLANLAGFSLGLSFWRGTLWEERLHFLFGKFGYEMTLGGRHSNAAYWLARQGLGQRMQEEFGLPNPADANDPAIIEFAKEVYAKFWLSRLVPGLNREVFGWAVLDGFEEAIAEASEWSLLGLPEELGNALLSLLSPEERKRSAFGPSFNENLSYPLHRIRGMILDAIGRQRVRRNNRALSRREYLQRIEQMRYGGFLRIASGPGRLPVFSEVPLDAGKKILSEDLQGTLLVQPTEDWPPLDKNDFIVEHLETIRAQMQSDLLWAASKGLRRVAFNDVEDYCRERIHPLAYQDVVRLANGLLEGLHKKGDQLPVEILIRLDGPIPADFRAALQPENWQAARTARPVLPADLLGGDIVHLCSPFHHYQRAVLLSNGVDASAKFRILPIHDWTDDFFGFERSKRYLAEGYATHVCEYSPSTLKTLGLRLEKEPIQSEPYPIKIGEKIEFGWNGQKHRGTVVGIVHRRYLIVMDGPVGNDLAGFALYLPIGDPDAAFEKGELVRVNQWEAYKPADAPDAPTGRPPRQSLLDPFLSVVECRLNRLAEERGWQWHAPGTFISGLAGVMLVVGEELFFRNYLFGHLVTAFTRLWLGVHLGMSGPPALMVTRAAQLAVSIVVFSILHWFLNRLAITIFPTDEIEPESFGAVTANWRIPLSTLFTLMYAISPGLNVIVHLFYNRLALKRDWPTMSMFGIGKKQWRPYAVPAAAAETAVEGDLGERMQLNKVVEAQLFLEKFGVADIKGVHLNLQMTPEELWVTRKPIGRLGDLEGGVIAEAIHNAIKYTPKGGTVSVRIWREGSEAVYQVKDSGLGMTDEEKQRVGQSVYRSERAKAIEANGNGMGLLAMRDLVRYYDGRMTIESSGPGLGTTVTIRLPLASAAAPAKLDDNLLEKLKQEIFEIMAAVSEAMQESYEKAGSFTQDLWDLRRPVESFNAYISSVLETLPDPILFRRLATEIFAEKYAPQLLERVQKIAGAFEDLANRAKEGEPKEESDTTRFSDEIYWVAKQLGEVRTLIRRAA